MRFKTLVLIPLFAVLAITVHNKNAQIVSLPKSQSQTSANAPQEYTITKEQQIADYLSLRNKETVSRSFKRINLGKEIVSTGKNYFGVPYCNGGETPKCFDCSGFTQYIYNKSGVNLPRSVDEQLKSMTIIPNNEAQEGDLVFFLNSKGYAYHVGIYVGGNTILHSPKPGRRVKLEGIWSTRVVFAR